MLNAVVFNADEVRANISRDLGFSHEDGWPIPQHAALIFRLIRCKGMAGQFGALAAALCEDADVMALVAE